MLLIEETPTSITPVYVIVGLIITNILGPILTSYFKDRKTDRANINETDAQTSQIKADTVNKTTTLLLEVADQFRTAQEDYLKMVDNFGSIKRNVLTLIELCEDDLNGKDDPRYVRIRRQVVKMRQEFFPTTSSAK